MRPGWAATIVVALLLSGCADDGTDEGASHETIRASVANQLDAFLRADVEDYVRYVDEEYCPEKEHHYYEDEDAVKTKDEVRAKWQAFFASDEYAEFMTGVDSMDDVLRLDEAEYMTMAAAMKRAGDHAETPSCGHHVADPADQVVGIPPREREDGSQFMSDWGGAYRWAGDRWVQYGGNV